MMKWFFCLLGLIAYGLLFWALDTWTWRKTAPFTNHSLIWVRPAIQTLSLPIPQRCTEYTRENRPQPRVSADISPLSIAKSICQPLLALAAVVTVYPPLHCCLVPYHWFSRGILATILVYQTLFILQRTFHKHKMLIKVSFTIKTTFSVILKA